MKLLLILQILLLPLAGITQNLIAYDYIEDYNWGGYWWGSSPTSGYYNNISVSSDLSAAMFGANFGNNITQFNFYEYDWYVLPSLSVDPSKDHTFKMRVSGNRISNPGASTAGIDVQDFMEIQLSTDGGVNYIPEMRVTGFSNCRWDYNNNATASKVVDGSLTTFTPSGGGDRTSLGDGYSIIELYIPAGNSSIAIDIYVRANRNGEDWWFDNFELWEESIITLPVELISFEGIKTDDGNVIKWVTASEHNTDYYLLQKSTNGDFNDDSTIDELKAAGNSTNTLTYTTSDFGVDPTINYYRLIQYDNDGNFKIYGPIAIDNRHLSKKLIKIVNTIGQEVDENSTGILFEVYSDGTTKKIIR